MDEARRWKEDTAVGRWRMSVKARREAMRRDGALNERVTSTRRGPRHVGKAGSRQGSGHPGHRSPIPLQPDHDHHPAHPTSPWTFLSPPSSDALSTQPAKPQTCLRFRTKHRFSPVVSSCVACLADSRVTYWLRVGTHTSCSGGLAVACISCHHPVSV